MLSDQDVTRIARRSFELYREHRLRDGLPVEYERYEDQPPTLIRSGIAQVRDIEAKAGALGLELVPLAEAAGREEVLRLGEDQVELLARREHERWCEERERDGWTLGPHKSTEHKVTPYLVPYEELSEEVREYDREPVRTMASLLRSAGFALCR